MTLVPKNSQSAVGIVVIGRNEGERLRRCLVSIVGCGAPVVYVDSGSSDGSVALARSMGVDVVEVDASRPYTAARGRNAGLHRLREGHDEVVFVQFVDGDCILCDGWLEAAAAFLQREPRVAAVCGRLREARAECTRYTRLCEIEWNLPAGEALACGGISMMRVAAFEDVSGFNPDLIAGEEPELCQRLRRAEWRIVRLDAEMAVHDAAITRFSQWWRRATRSGYGTAEGFAMHGRGPARYRRREVMSIVFWAFLLPALLVGLAWPTGGWSMLGYGLYGVQWWRIARANVEQSGSASGARLYAAFCIIGKWAELQGMAWYVINRLRGHRARIIEYKSVDRLHPQADGRSAEA